MTIERWERLMATWGFEPSRETFDALIRAYSESQRHYHTIEHVSACLGHMDRFIDKLERPGEVEIALWFHDAIYRPFSSRNEKASADWAATFLSSRGTSTGEVDRVHRLIMATEHNAPAQTKDESALVDFDLSILGAHPATYDVFEQAIRKEYKRVPMFIYRKKRAELLRGFLNRPLIYTSGCFSADRERRARDNLSRAISALEDRV